MMNHTSRNDVEDEVGVFDGMNVNIFIDMDSLYERGITLADQEQDPDHKAWITNINQAMLNHIYALKTYNIASFHRPLHRYHYQNIFDIEDHEVDGHVFRVILIEHENPTEKVLGFFFTVDNEEIKDVRISQDIVFNLNQRTPPRPWEYPEHLSFWLHAIAKMYYDLYLGNYQKAMVDGEYVYPEPAKIEKCLLEHFIDVNPNDNIEKIVKYKTVLQKASELLQHFVNNAKNYHAAHRYNADIGRWQFLISDDDNDQCYISFHHWSDKRDIVEKVSIDIHLRDVYIVYTTEHDKPYLEYYDHGVYTATTDDVWVVGKAITNTLEEQVLWYISSGIC